MNYYYIYRNFVLGLCLILTFPALGLIGHWTTGSGSQVLSFEGMGLFVSCVSLLVFPILLVLPEFRKNAFILYILSEITIILVMWIFWLTTMALVIEERELKYPLGDCSVGLPNDQIHWCTELYAIQGLCIVIFVFLLKYLLFLTLFAFINHARGVNIWMKSVKELQIKMPVIKLTHSSSSSDVDFENNTSSSKADVSLIGAPNSAAAYPPPQQAQAQVPYAQPQPPPPPKSQYTYTSPYPNPNPNPNPSMPYTNAPQGMHLHVAPPAPVPATQTISYSRPPLPNSVPGFHPQNPAHYYNPAVTTPAVPQI